MIILQQAGGFSTLTAWRRATGIEVNSSLQRAQQFLVDLETLREHLWQVLVIWPKLLGIAPDENSDLSWLSSLLKNTEYALFGNKSGISVTTQLSINAEAFRDIVMELQKFIEKNVFAMDLQQWSGIDSLQTLQPVLEEQILYKRFVSSERNDFIVWPLWQNMNYETTAFARQFDTILVQNVSEIYGDGLLSRMVARLLELSGLIKRLFEDLSRLINDRTVQFENDLQNNKVDGEGLAMIEAA